MVVFTVSQRAIAHGMGSTRMQSTKTPRFLSWEKVLVLEKEWLVVPE